MSEREQIEIEVASSDLKCPKCNEPWKCPCKHCVHREGPSKWKWTNDGHNMQCPCGFDASGDFWFELSMESLVFKGEE